LLHKIFPVCLAHNTSQTVLILLYLVNICRSGAASKSMFDLHNSTALA